MLYIDQANPREANPGWKDHAPYPETCITQGRCTQGALPAMPTVIPLLPQTTQTYAAKQKALNNGHMESGGGNLGGHRVGLLQN